MNLTKEQILEEELSEDILEIIEQKDKPEELRYFKRYILDAMERYAQQKVKNLNIPAVVWRSEQLVCEHPDEAIIKDKPTDYCLACNRNI